MSDPISIRDALERQRAQDPTRSCIVQAPAGSGKTTLLAKRYVALLGTVQQPEEILAITFTKKAAAEMRQRVGQELTDPDSELGRAAVAHAEANDWQLHRYPGRLRIQTIDAFATSLVRQLPVTSQLQQRDISPHPEECYQQAVARVMRRINAAPERGVQATLSAALLRDFLGNSTQVHNLLVTMLRRREQWQFMLMEQLANFDNSRLMEAIANGIAQLQRQALQSLAGSIATPLQTSLFDHARYARDMLELKPGFDALDEFEKWRFVANHLVFVGAAKLGDLQVRKKLTKTQGFPPKQANTHKEDMHELLGRLQEEPEFQPMLTALVAIREMPSLQAAELDRDRLSVIGTVLFECVNELTTLFTERGEVDYNQITIAAITALGTEDAPSDLALSLDYRISHLLIDEFQDTSRAQHELFSRLTREWAPGDGNSFFAVGDPMQSIYRFRNAEVSLFLDVCEHGMNNLPLEHLRLTTNFRSANPMISWFNSVFAKVLGDQDDSNLGAISYAHATSPRGELTAVSTAEVRAPLHLSATTAEQHEQLVAHIKQLASTCAWTDIAILVRNRTPVGNLVHALEAANIPWQGTDLHALSQTAIVSDLVCLAETLADPAARVSMFALARGPLVGLSLNDLKSLSIALHEAQQPEHVATMRPGEAPVYSLPEVLIDAHLSTAGSARLKRLQAIAQPLLQRRLTLAPRELVESLWLRLGGPLAYPARTHKHAARLLDVLELGHPRRLDTHRLRRDVGALFAEDDGTGVQLLTVHKSKGLQYKHVILPAMEAGTRADDAQLLMMRESSHGMLMACKAAGSDSSADKKNHSLYHWLKEEDKERAKNETRRVLYVAATRAEESLALFATLPAHKRPAANSLLNSLEPVYGDLWEERDPKPDEAVSGTGAISASEIRIDRLPATLSSPHLPGPAVNLPSRARRVTTHRSGPQLDNPELLFAQERRAAIIRGNLVHEALCALTRTLGKESDADAERRREATQQLIGEQQPLWLSHAIESGIHDELAHRVATDTATSLLSVADSALGQWCALAPQTDSQAELPVTLWEQAGPMKLVVDRTFVLAGSRWIIDYKTASPVEATADSSISGTQAQTAPDAANETWLRTELERYSNQLGGYARALGAIYPEQEIRTALYFTATDELWELLRSGSAAGSLLLENGLGAQKRTLADLDG